ncbi:MAG TPA: TonB-dependent receptor plug domain-containing protein, partial [Bacteroidales bacterium]|nr:TonB-dependent receptor plug domain-containing protein [Bacteroidales bacterium]
MQVAAQPGTSTEVAPADSIPATQLGEVIIKAYGGRQYLMQIPASVSVVSTADIRNSADRGTTALLNSVPGVFAHQGTFNTNRITIRGIGARIPYATGRIRAAIDEVPLTNGSGYSMAEYIDPGFADHIEVVKSPTTPAHGASLGGTIHISTLPDGRLHNSVDYTIMSGSFGLLNQNIRLTHGSPTWSGTMLIKAGSADGWRENNSHRQYFGGYSARYDLSDNTRLSGLVVWQQMKAYIPSSIDSVTFFKAPHKAAPNWLKTRGFEDGRRMLGGLTLDQKLPHNYALKATMYGHHVAEEELRPFDHFTEQRRLGGIRLHLEKQVLIDNYLLKLTAGTETYTETVRFGNVINTDGEGSLGDSISRNNEHIRSTAFFVQANYLGAGNTLNAGIYLQQLNNRFTNRSLQLGR